MSGEVREREGCKRDSPPDSAAERIPATLRTLPAIWRGVRAHAVVLLPSALLVVSGALEDGGHSIAAFKGDAVVNSTNAQCAYNGGGGVDGEIHLAGGEALVAARSQLGVSDRRTGFKITPGDAVPTLGGGEWLSDNHLELPPPPPAWS